MARDNRRKKSKNPLLRFFVIIFFIILIGFFIFYSIDNPGFIKGLFDRGKDSDPKAAILEETVTLQEEIIQTETEEAQVSKDPSLWQSILTFFKDKFSPQEEADNYPSRITINIYFARTGEEKVFAAEKRTVIAGNPGNALKGAMEELLKGPLQDYHFPVVPSGTRLLGSRFSDGVAEVDLSREFLDNALDTRILDEYIIYSIVNTVTEIPDIGGVIFFIEGKRIKTYGNIDLSIPLIRNPDFLIEAD